MRLVPAYLVRHAHAGSRSHWEGPDDQRPLSPKGQRQARHLEALLAEEPISRVLTSPAVRCTQTVEPLAAALGLPVEPTPLLAEGADPVAAIEHMLATAPASPVLCSHGDLIPEIIRLLRRRGMRVVDDGPTKKGSFWALEFDGEAFTKATYHPPGG